jgi:uncharacterized protein (TIGR02118 family)
MFCASVAYPTDAATFDFGYFRDQHAPLFARILGDNCVRFEVHRGLAAPGAPPPPFVAAAYFWVTSAGKIILPRTRHYAPQSAPPQLRQSKIKSLVGV